MDDYLFNTTMTHNTVTMFLSQSFSAASAVQTNSSYEFKIAFSHLHTAGGYLYNCAINNRANLTGEYRERL